MCQPSSQTSQIARRIFVPSCSHLGHVLHARHFHAGHRSCLASREGLGRHAKWKRSKHLPHCSMSPGGSRAFGSTSLPLWTHVSQSHGSSGIALRGGERHCWWYCFVHPRPSHSTISLPAGESPPAHVVQYSRDPAGAAAAAAAAGVAAGGAGGPPPFCVEAFSSDGPTAPAASAPSPSAARARFASGASAAALSAPSRSRFFARKPPRPQAKHLPAAAQPSSELS